MLQYIVEIPCEEIKTLEDHADKAKIFVKQLEDGEVPSMIRDLPKDLANEAFQDFKAVINIALALPSEIIKNAEAAATDAANLFDDIEDGSIIQDIESLPGVVLSDVTKGWAGVPDALTDGWGDIASDVGCLFKSCSESTPIRSCRTAAATATTSDEAVTITRNATRRTTHTLPLSTILMSVTSTQSPPQYPSPTSLANTKNSHKHTSTASLTSVQNPPQYTGTASASSVQRDWVGLVILMTAAAGVLASILCL